MSLKAEGTNVGLGDRSSVFIKKIVAILGSIDCVLIGNIEERLGLLTLLVTVVPIVEREDKVGVTVLCAKCKVKMGIVDAVGS